MELVQAQHFDKLHMPVCGVYKMLSSLLKGGITSRIRLLFSYQGVSLGFLHAKGHILSVLFYDRNTYLFHSFFHNGCNQ
ncbi:MAG: hypothetical protein ACI87V_000159 [Flavobacteriales bacterium]|jgi:hypothetical protein